LARGPAGARLECVRPWQEESAANGKEWVNGLGACQNLKIGWHKQIIPFPNTPKAQTQCNASK
jgi:hypothetical protein